MTSRDRDAMEKLPQRLVNIRAADRGALKSAIEDAPVREAIEREQSALADAGGCSSAPSGTEPLIRVMVEAPSSEETDAVCGRLVELVERAIG